MKHSVAADAAFLRQQQHDAETATAAAAAELRQDSLLPLQVGALLEECGGCGSSGNGSLGAKAARYAESVAELLRGMPAATNAALNRLAQAQGEGGGAPWAAAVAPPSASVSCQQEAAAAAALFADDRLAAAAHPLGVLLRDHHHHHPSALQPPLLRAAFNARVPPTLELAVLMPNSLWEPRDHRNGRYFRKRNVVVWYVAKYLIEQQQLQQQKQQQQTNSSSKGSSSSKKRKSRANTADDPVDDTTAATATAAAAAVLVGTRLYWRYHCHDRRKVVLLLVPRNGGKKKRHAPPRFRLQLNFAMQDLDWIRPSPLRLVPNRNNNHNNSSSGETTATSASSVFYNHCLTEDALHLFLPPPSNSETAENDNLRRAAQLLQIWCLQRGLLRGHDALSGPQIDATLAYLHRTRRVSGRAAALQVAAACWKLWSELLPQSDDDDSCNDNRDDTVLKQPTKANRVKVLVLPLPGKTESQTIAGAPLAQLYRQQTRESPLTDRDPPTLLELYQQTTTTHDGSGTPVLLDSTMRHNFWGRWSPAFARQLQRQARKSLECLNRSGGANNHSAGHSSSSAFRHLFLTNARFWNCHDAYLRIPLRDIDTATAATATVDDDANYGNSYEAVARKLVDVLQRALGDRVRSIQCLTTGNGNPTTATASKNESGGTWMQDSDEIPTFALTTADSLDAAPSSSSKRQPLQPQPTLQSPTGSDALVVGITLRPDTCFRVVDRGPPGENAAALRDFLQLWGPKAELRRFKDGAIVHAVVWETRQQQPRVGNDGDGDNYVAFQNDDTWQGGIVERIIRHILQLHFLKPKKHGTTDLPKFALRNLLTTVDGVVPSKLDETTNKATLLLINPLTAHRTAMKAMESLTEFLRSKSAQNIPVVGSATEMKSALGIPLTIDAVEPLSPSLRYASLYPPVPHPMLGGTTLPGQKRASGAVQWDPLEIQIRFGASSKWPTDLKAIGASKTAMLIALVNGIEALKKAGKIDRNHFDGPMVVTPSHTDLCYMGYVFRIFVRADPELHLLRSLRRPTPAAAELLRALTRCTVVAATHHSLVHAVYTSHPSSSAVVRLAQRWWATHLLSDQVSLEAVELMVAHVYTDPSSPLDAPGTATVGFLRFLQLLSQHDWVREPLIVDPQHHLSRSDHLSIQSQFETTRGSSYQNGPAMYIVSPCTHAHLEEDDVAAAGEASSGSDRDKQWSPIYTASHPERVVLSRAVALAERTHSFLQSSIMDFEDSTWPAVFQESAESFRSFSALLRVDPGFAVNAEASSTSNADRSLNITRNASDGNLESTYTRSMRSLVEGPKDLRRKLYRNLMANPEDDIAGILLEWRPVKATVAALRRKLGHLALFFYNELCPDVVAVVWRPYGQPRAFSALVSEYVQPAQTDAWQSDTLVTLNVGDLLREIGRLTVDVVTDVKVFDSGPSIQPPSVGSKRKRPTNDEEASSSSSDSSESESE